MWSIFIPLRGRLLDPECLLRDWYLKLLFRVLDRWWSEPVSDFSRLCRRSEKFGLSFETGWLLRRGEPYVRLFLSLLIHFLRVWENWIFTQIFAKILCSF